MPYLRVGDRVCSDGTFGLMLCSDFYLPKYSVKDWVEKMEEVENEWAGNTLRQLCTFVEGCAWSVSLTFKLQQEMTVLLFCPKSYNKPDHHHSV